MGNYRIIEVLSVLAFITSLSAPTHAEPSETDAIPRPYAVIDWPNQRNPKFVTLRNNFFLLSTRSGIKVWDAEQNIITVANNWPAHTGVGRIWSQLEKGTVVVGDRHNADDVPFSSMLWWDSENKKFSEPLETLPGESIEELVPIQTNYVLACLRMRDSSFVKSWRELETQPTKAFVVNLENGRLQRIPTHTHQVQSALLSAGVRGPIDDGIQLVDVASTKPPPVIFNTGTCKWEMRNPPDELTRGEYLSIKHYRLPDGRFIVAHADWFVAEEGNSGVWKRLPAPYLWNSLTERWLPIASKAQEGDSAYAFSHYGIEDQVVSITTVDSQFVEYLNPNTLGWMRSEQQLPRGSYGPILAPLGQDKTLVFLRENGHVLVFTPMIAPKLGKFAYGHSYVGEVPLSDGGLLLLGGGSQWHPANRPEILELTAAGPQTKMIAPLPAPWNDMIGVELRDKSILVFGGLPSGCAPSSTFDSCKNIPPSPSYRYLPREDRWEEVPELRLRFSYGMSLAYGNSQISTQWPRNDVVARTDGDLVFVDGLTNYEVQDRSMLPLASNLMRWRAGSPPTKLVKLKEARIFPTVVELNDKRLVVVGGETAKRLEISAEQCPDCNENTASVGAMEPATSTEIYDRANEKLRAGPRANYEGGRALKLANGKVFKLSLARRWSAEEGYRAEISDMAFTRWKKLPPLPIKQFNLRHMTVAGNRILLFADKASDKTIVWDDERKAWKVWDSWFKTEPLSVIPIDSQRAIISSYWSYEIASFPK